MEKDTRRLGRGGRVCVSRGDVWETRKGSVGNLRFVAKFACQDNFFLTGGVVELRTLVQAATTRGVGRLTSKELLSR